MDTYMYVSLYVGKIIVTEVPLLLAFLSFPGVLHIYINECGVHFTYTWNMSWRLSASKQIINAM